MKIKPTFIGQLVGLSLLGTLSSSAGIALVHGLPYTQNFDTLPFIGGPLVKGTLPDYWTFNETGPNRDEVYVAGTGGIQDTYSFGASPNREDRSFGGISGVSVRTTIGAKFTNNLGVGTIDLTISFVGEQWHLGGVPGTQLEFQYSTDANSITTGTWVDYNQLDFSSPNAVGGFTLNGNLPENRTFVSAVIPSVVIPSGGNFWIRWGFTGGTDGLSIDDFSITAIPEPSGLFLIAPSIALLLATRRRDTSELSCGC